MTVQDEMMEEFPVLYRVTRQGKVVWQGEDWHVALEMYRQYRQLGYADSVKLECW